MYFKRGQQNTHFHFRSRKKIRLINHAFQYKYTFVLLITITLSLLTCATPLYFFAKKNYDLFSNLAYSIFPEIIEQLNREWFWAQTFFFFLFLGVLIFCAYAGLKITSQFITPIHLLEGRLKKLSHGIWDSPEIKVRSGDEFQELINAFNYFYKSLQTNAEVELSMLLKLDIDFKNQEAVSVWKQLIAIKESQINVRNQDLIDVYPVVIHDSRHAS